MFMIIHFAKEKMAFQNVAGLCVQLVSFFAINRKRNGCVGISVNLQE